MCRRTVGACKKTPNRRGLGGGLAFPGVSFSSLCYVIQSMRVEQNEEFVAYWCQKGPKTPATMFSTSPSRLQNKTKKSKSQYTSDCLPN